MGSRLVNKDDHTQVIHTGKICRLLYMVSSVTGEFEYIELQAFLISLL